MCNSKLTIHVTGAALALVLFSDALARDLDADLRTQVIASCSSDAYRLCPQSLGNENDAVSCMRKHRTQLGAVCRVAYDKVIRTLAQR